MNKTIFVFVSIIITDCFCLKAQWIYNDTTYLFSKNSEWLYRSIDKKTKSQEIKIKWQKDTIITKILKSHYDAIQRWFIADYFDKNNQKIYSKRILFAIDRSSEYSYFKLNEVYYLYQRNDTVPFYPTSVYQFDEGIWPVPDYKYNGLNPNYYTGTQGDDAVAIYSLEHGCYSINGRKLQGKKIASGKTYYGDNHLCTEFGGWYYQGIGAVDQFIIPVDTCFDTLTPRCKLVWYKNGSQNIYYHGVTPVTKCWFTNVYNPNVLEKINVYPNPAQHYLTIEGVRNARIWLMDINGRVLLETNSGADRFKTISSVGFAPGTYILRVANPSGNMLYTKVIIKP